MRKKISKIKKNCLFIPIQLSGSARKACPPLRQMRRGFSLIEVLISLLILSIGITAITILMANNVKNLQTSKNQIIASQLAQEGVELVRNLKDNNATLFKSDGIDKPSGSDYRIDINTTYGNFSNDSNTDKKLYLNSNFYIHTSGGGIATKFFRKIKIFNNATDKQVEITCYVSWNSKGFIDELLNVDATNCNIANKCVSTVSIIPD